MRMACHPSMFAGRLTRCCYSNPKSAIACTPNQDTDLWRRRSTVPNPDSPTSEKAEEPSQALRLQCGGCDDRRHSGG